MSYEVDWVMQTIDENYGYGVFPYGTGGYGDPPPLNIVDRDESELYDSTIRERTGALKEANYVGVSHADTASTPVGTEYDHRRETIVSLRIEGLHARQWGHVDPEGTDDAKWRHIVNAIRDTLLLERCYPDAGGPDVTYTHLRFDTEEDLSDRYGDHFRTDIDVLFRGYEDVPTN